MEEAGAASNASNAGEASNASEVNGVVAVKEKARVVSVSAVQLLILDLVQLLCGKMSERL